MANSKRKCKHCKAFVLAETGVKLPAGFFCSMRHASDWAISKSRADAERKRKAKEKETKAKHRADLKRVRRNPRAEALIAAQLLARISRADDNGYCTCVTCGKVGKYNDGFDGGHFIEKSKSSYWMLDPRNIHPQCKPCNKDGMKYGGKNVVYTLWMIDTYGREFVDHMEEMKRTRTSYKTVDYDEYIAKAKAEIRDHEKRIGKV